MRPSTRLLATVKSKYLSPNTPTGLTGLSTHPSPRPALIYTYRQTLSKLTSLPKSSVYRQSTEALTKSRLAIIEAVLPEGYEEWLARVKKQIELSPDAYGKMIGSDGSFSYETIGQTSPVAWDGVVKRSSAQQEGSNDLKAVQRKAEIVEGEAKVQEVEDVQGVAPQVDDLEAEPALSRDQISEIETKLAAGLIEEVVTVAEGELELVEEMLKYQPWQELEEPIPDGQWSYFERGDRV